MGIYLVVSGQVFQYLRTRSAWITSGENDARFPGSVGDGVVAPAEVLDPTDPNLLNTVTLVFDTPGTYQVNGVGPSIPYTSGANIDVQVSVSTDPDWTLQGVEVQYKDHTDGVWHVIQGNTGIDPDHVLQGEPGHVYTVRARPWQEQGAYDLHGLWVEKQVQVGGAFIGFVRIFCKDRIRKN